MAMSRRTSQSLRYQLLVLFAVFAFVPASNVFGADQTSHAGLTVTIQAGGRASYNFKLITSAPLTEAQRRSIEAVLGAALMERGAEEINPRDELQEADDENLDSIQTAQPAQGPPPAPLSPPFTSDDFRSSAAMQQFYLTAEWTKQLVPDGGAIDDQIDASGLFRAVNAAGAHRLTILVAHPRTGYSACTRQSEPDIPFPAWSSTEFHTYFLSDSTDAAQPALIRISYGYTAKMLATRAGWAGMFLLIPVSLVLWRTLAATRSSHGDGVAERFAAVRLLNLICIAVPISWWMLRSVTGARSLIQFLDAGYAFWPRLTIEIVALVVPPFLSIAVCALILKPLLERGAGDGGKARSFRDAARLMLGIYLPVLLLVTGGAEFVRGDLSLGISYIVAGQVCRWMSRLFKPRALVPHELIVTSLRQRVLELASRAGVQLRRVLVVPDNNARLANAYATAGNDVMLCEYLLGKLSKREIDGVVAHEISHIRSNHARLQAMVASATIGIAVGLRFMLMFGGADLLLGPRDARVFSAYVLIENGPDLLLAAAVLISVLVTLVLSRRFEYSADSTAVWITGDPEAMITGLVKVARLNLMPMTWGRFDEKLLTHPSMQRRIHRIAAAWSVPPDRLRSLIANPDLGDEFFSLSDVAAPAGRQAGPADPQARPAAQPVRRSSKNRKPLILTPIKTAGLAMLACFFFTVPGQRLRTLLDSAGIPTAMAIGAVGALALIHRSYMIKARILKVMPDHMSFVHVRPDDYPSLDVKTLAAWTAELEGLGFAAVADYSTDYKGKRLLAFARLFINQQRRCFVQLNQVMSGTVPVTSMQCDASSFIEGGWTLDTNNQVPKAVGWANRDRKALRVYLPGATPTEVYREHLSLRQRILSELGAQLCPDLTADYYFQRSAEASSKRKARLKRMLALTYIFRLDMFYRSPSNEWLGRFANCRPDSVHQVSTTASSQP
jgi:heat shock protein HtpX